MRITVPRHALFVLFSFVCLSWAQPVLAVVGGDPAPPADSNIVADLPNGRVDPNVITSSFTGVGALGRVERGSGSPQQCTATLLNRNTALTAAHCFDTGDDDPTNSDGYFDGPNGVINDGDWPSSDLQFHLNATGDSSFVAELSGFVVHPDFLGNGFAPDDANDDIALFRLSRQAPLTSQNYRIDPEVFPVGSSSTFVGYGFPGDGVTGYSTVRGLNSVNVKRVGGQTLDLFQGQDDADRVLTNEVFRIDFDSEVATHADGRLGGDSLGNTVEAWPGPGDSGMPFFAISSETAPRIRGIEVGVEDVPSNGRFGGEEEGLLVAAYVDFIDLHRMPTILSVATTESLGGVADILDGDIIQHDSLKNASSRLVSEGSFSHNVQVDAVHHMANGSLVISISGANATVGGIEFDQGDLVQYDVATNKAAKLFDGSVFAEEADVDAIFLRDDGRLILSTNAEATLPGMTFEEGDLVEIIPGSTSDLANGVWGDATATVIFDGNDGLSAGANIDAVHILPNGNLVLSTAETATLGNVTIEAGDLAVYDPVREAFSFLFFDGDNTALGTAQGFEDGDGNIDSFSMLHLAFEDFVSEPVPEPQGFLLLVLGLLLITRQRRNR